MGALHDDVFDNGLSVLSSNVEKLYLGTNDFGLTWANIASYAVAEKSAPSIASPSDRSGGGREVVVAAISDGVITATATDPDCEFWALTDDSATKILASGQCAAGQAVTSGNTFTLTQFSIGIPDPA